MKKISMDPEACSLIPVFIPVFDQRLTFIYGDDFDLIEKWIENDIRENVILKNAKTLRKILKELRKEHDKHEGCYIHRKNWRIIYVKKQNTLMDFLKITIHEVYHATQQILHHLGVTPTDSSEEVYAYLNEYIMNEIMKEMLEEEEEKKQIYKYEEAEV